MTEAFLDTNVFLYAVGAEHRYRDPCRAVIRLSQEGRFQGIVNVEVVQEVTHVRLRRTGDREDAARLGRAIREGYDTLPVEAEDIDLALQIFKLEPRLTVRDAIHLATMRNRGITTIITADRDFEGLDGIRRIDPVEWARAH